MTTYAALNMFFLATIGIGLLVYTRQKPRPILWVTLGILLLMTAVFDSLFILLGLFEYNPASILGVFVWRAPIEDFAYTVASVGIVGMLWEMLEAKNTKKGTNDT